VLAYVFWHWPSADTAEYEAALVRFHQALTEAAPAGFVRSTCLRVDALPWDADRHGYEDWYLVEDWAALGVLNEGAVTGRPRGPHDEAALRAAGGAGGLLRHRSGPVVPRPEGSAAWFGKPPGWSYDQVEDLGGRFTVWHRQMVLGPAPEFCAFASASLDIPHVVTRGETIFC
jgi:hypothetical protein